VLRLFGFCSQPFVALVATLALSSLVSVVEETSFRGLLLPALASGLQSIGMPTTPALASATFGTTLLFAMLHLNPRAWQPTPEAAVSVALQLSGGLTFAAVALNPAGGLGAAIVTHALYDFMTIYLTHLKVTDRVR
jgi:membrane protease YdiL (CAAX protease family)